LIEDDSSLCRLMTTYFAQHGFSVDAAHDGLSGLSRALDGFHDVIILDVMLPCSTASKSCASCASAA